MGCPSPFHLNEVCQGHALHLPACLQLTTQHKTNPSSEKLWWPDRCVAGSGFMTSETRCTASGAEFRGYLLLDGIHIAGDKHESMTFLLKLDTETHMKRGERTLKRINPIFVHDPFGLVT
jgi:hypothetical protein